MITSRLAAVALFPTPLWAAAGDADHSLAAAAVLAVAALALSRRPNPR